MNGLIPSIHGTSYLYIAVGIVGATVMPHVIYLHSALTKGRMSTRNDPEKKRVLRFERLDMYIALGLAGLVNLAMLAFAAKLFHTPALSGLSTIPQAHVSSDTSSAALPRSRSPSRCSPPEPPPQASAPTPARS